jgi:fructose transport system substrate-binding protein
MGLLLFCQLILAACGVNPTSSAPATVSANPTFTPQSGQILVGFIAQAENNPFFPKLKEAAEQEAQLKGAKLVVASDATPEGQAAAIEDMVSAGVKGIVIYPVELKKIVPAILKAREKGVLMVGLGTPSDSAEALDAILDGDNKQAGALVGRYIKTVMVGKPIKLAVLEGPTTELVSAGRHTGLVEGFGLKDGDPQLACSQLIQYNPASGQAAMESCLQKEPGINVVYTVAEPVAFGAYNALKAAGKEKDVLLVSFNGSCPGVQAVKEGKIGATVLYSPYKTIVVGIDALIDHARVGKKVASYLAAEGIFITDQPQEGISSKDTSYGLNNCW